MRTRRAPTGDPASAGQVLAPTDERGSHVRVLLLATDCADRLGLRLDSLTAVAEGDLDVRGFFALDDSVRSGFSAVRVTVHVSGPDRAEDYERLHRIVDEHCPVLDLTRNPTPVSTTPVVNEI